jgi:Putative auto-transporter adhesin, head GIN domain
MNSRIYLPTLLFFFVLFIPGILNASMPEDKQIRQVKAFTAISVSSGIDLYLEYGQEEKVSVDGDLDEISKIITEVKDGTLYIYKKNKSGLNFGFHNSCEVSVTAKILEVLDASAGSEVKGRNQFSGSEFRLNTSSGSEVKIDVVYDKIKADASSGSEIRLNGKTRLLEVTISSGSEIDACDLAADIVRADVSSGGQACVNAISELHANASSGGDIDYAGSPKSIDINKSSGGRISRD